MDLQLMDYRNSSKCASAPPLCFRNAASSTRPGSGGHVRLFNGRGRLFYERDLLWDRVAGDLKRDLLFRCTGSPPLMTTSTRTRLCIRPSRPPATCWQAASSVSSRTRPSPMKITASSCYSGKAAVVWCKDGV